jgi:hypothetical protein
MRNMIRLTFMMASLALMLWSSILNTQAAEQSTDQSIPEVMAERTSTQGDAPTVNTAPVQATWVDEIRSSLAMYKKNYPTSNFDPYLKKLNLAGEAVGRGDRRMVKVEMGSFFKMLATRANGISDIAAEELTNFAQMVAPIQEYGISVPRSGSSQYGSEVPSSASSQ